MNITNPRKTKIFILAAALVLAAAAGPYANTGDDAVLTGLLETAERENPRLGAAMERAERAGAALSEAASKQGPNFIVGAGALWNKDSPLLPLPNAQGVQIGGVPLGFRNTYVAALGFTQTIYAGGSLTASRQAAFLARSAAVAERLRVYQSVCYSVRCAYFNLRRAEEKENVVREAARLASEHQKRAERLFKAGVVAAGDVLRSKVAAADAELNLIRARNAAEIALTAIEQATGAPVNRDDLRPSAGGAGGRASLEKPDGGLETAYRRRPELRVYSLLSRQADKVARAERGRLLPQILLGGSLSGVDDSFFPDGGEEWRVGAVMYWTLYDSGQAAARTRQARAQARELLCNLEEMKNSVKMELKQAELNLKSAESRLTVAERQVAEAEEDYRIAVKRYEARIGTNLDMLDSRLALTNSRTELADAAYDIEIAKAGLIYALGGDMPPGELAEEIERAKIFD